MFDTIFLNFFLLYLRFLNIFYNPILLKFLSMLYYNELFHKIKDNQINPTI